MPFPAPIRRLLAPPKRSFFLFGPRGTGKSTWLRQALPKAAWFDLLDHSLFMELSADPHRLEAMVGAARAGSWVVLDEVQKVPALLDEVHRLIEGRGWHFALCGSSARKLRRGGANLLAGRALNLTLEGFSAAELGAGFRLEQALELGLLPLARQDPGLSLPTLAAYVSTYLREELLAEGLIRNAPPFARFLAVAGRANGQVLNAQNIAREAQVARATVDTYFAILYDTLLAHALPAWRPGFKVREAAQPKFHWFDPGVARAAAGLLHEPADRAWQGFALETLVFHELRVHNQVSGKDRPISYYRTPAGVEVDFIIETAMRRQDRPAQVTALKVKRSEKWDRAWEKPMLSLANEPKLKIGRLIGIYTGSRRYRFGPVEVLPLQAFLEELHQGRLY